MSFSINTNVTSLQAQNALRSSSDFQAKTINRVTTGLRIVNSGDDAAGLAIANGYRSDQAVLTQGIANAGDGLATLQTIDGGMNNISLLLDRARTLATQSASTTFAGDRTQLNSEFGNVLSEIDRQSQAIGMNQGGKFNAALTTFVGGGKDATGLTANAAAIANGTVSVNLSTSAVDTKSLGLGSFKTVANLATSTTPTSLATIVDSGNLDTGTMSFKFNGAGFSDPAGSVTIAALNVGSANSLSDVVKDINTAIATASVGTASNVLAFKAAGVTASLSSDGTGIAFSSTTTQFSVAAAGTNTQAAENVLGTAVHSSGAAVSAAGAQSSTLAWKGATTIGDSQKLTFTTLDASGNQAFLDVTLTSTAALTKDDAIGQINTQLQAKGGNFAKLVAVDEDADATATGKIRIMGPQSFQTYVGSATASSAGGINGQLTTITSAVPAGSSAGVVDISTAENAQQSVNALANAVSALGTAQANVGKGENNFNYAMNLAQSQSTNLAASESRIRDADLASEAANLTKAQILMQAGTAALAQANSAPQAILSLLKG